MASGSSEPTHGTVKAGSDKGNAAPELSQTATAPSAPGAVPPQPCLPRGLCRLTLDIIDAGGAQRRAVFDPMESLLIGSGRSAGLRLADPSVAPVHCLLKLDGGELCALDLGSGRQTRLDGAPLQGQQNLRPGSRLALGDLTLRIASIEAAQNGTRDQLRPPALEVRLFWKGELLEVAQRQHGVLRIGSAARNDLRCFAPPCAVSLPLARIGAGVATVHLPPGARLTSPGESAEGEVGEQRALALAPAQALTLRLGESARIEWGDFSLIARMAESPPRQQSRRSSTGPLVPLFLLFSVALAALVWRFQESSVDEARWADEFFADRQKIERWVIALQPPSPPAPVEQAHKAAQEAAADLESARVPAPRQQMRRAGRPGKTSPESREKVMRAGLLGVLGGRGGLGMAGVLGGGGGLGGIDQALGQLKASTAGQAGMSGLGGLGLRGMPGSGGGLGIGGLGTGLGGGGGGQGDGRGSGGLGPKKALQRRVVPGKSVLAGSCEREVIGKVIGKNARQVLACYEAELVRTPDLAGKLAVRFTIEPTGKVGDLEITESTLVNPAIERCVESRIKRWRFPEPKGGGLCIVNYPWIFQQAGDGG